MNKQDYFISMGELFDKYVSRHTSDEKKKEFLEHSWTRFSGMLEPPLIDLTSKPAVAAMLRARKQSDSIQVQGEYFNKFYPEELAREKMVKP